jgi:hypothetical protein
MFMFSLDGANARVTIHYVATNIRYILTPIGRASMSNRIICPLGWRPGHQFLPVPFLFMFRIGCVNRARHEPHSHRPKVAFSFAFQSLTFA